MQRFEIASPKDANVLTVKGSIVREIRWVTGQIRKTKDLCKIPAPEEAHEMHQEHDHASLFLNNVTDVLRRAEISLAKSLQGCDDVSNESANVHDPDDEYHVALDVLIAHNERSLGCRFQNRQQKIERLKALIYFLKERGTIPPYPQVLPNSADAWDRDGSRF